MLKENIYKVIAHSGIWFLSRFFPEFFAVEPLRPTDRYIEYPFALSNLPKNKSKILDVGCSGSMFPLILKSLGHEVHGIDIRTYYPENEIFFYNNDIAVRTFEENTFDVITAISSIEHIGLKGRYGSKDELDGDAKAINEIYRILKPEGMFIMTVPSGEYLKIEKDHRIYDNNFIHLLLYKFKKYNIDLKQSPEANYKISLIKAYK